MQKDVKVTVGISGTGGGFKKFCTGETDISDASRPIKQTRDRRLQGQEHRVHRAAGRLRRLSVVVNPQNTWATCITVAELKKIWEPAAQGTITKWNQVRAGLARPDDQALRPRHRLRHLRLLHRGDQRQGRRQPRRLHRQRGRQRPGAGRRRRQVRARLLRPRLLRGEPGQAQGRAGRQGKGKGCVAPSAPDGRRRHLPSVPARCSSTSKKTEASRSRRSRPSWTSTCRTPPSSSKEVGYVKFPDTFYTLVKTRWTTGKAGPRMLATRRGKTLEQLLSSQ